MNSLNPDTSELVYPSKNYYANGMDIYVNSNVNLIEQGIDPKPLILEYCKPQCHFWKQKLERCEKALKTVIKINPGKTCLYPMRDYATCTEACTQPKVHNQLRGTDQHYINIV